MRSASAEADRIAGRSISSTNMLEKLKDILFGKRVTFEDHKIGALTTRIKSKNSSKVYSWSGDAFIINQTKITKFILAGNAKGPYSNHLESVHRIFDELEFIKEKVFEKFKNHNSETIGIEEWRKIWYVDFLYPLDENKNEFELVFESLDSEDMRVILVTWVNGVCKKVEGI